MMNDEWFDCVDNDDEWFDCDNDDGVDDDARYMEDGAQGANDWDGDQMYDA